MNLRYCCGVIGRGSGVTVGGGSDVAAAAAVAAIAAAVDGGVNSSNGIS